MAYREPGMLIPAQPPHAGQPTLCYSQGYVGNTGFMYELYRDIWGSGLGIAEGQWHGNLGICGRREIKVECSMHPQVDRIDS